MKTWNQLSAEAKIAMKRRLDNHDSKHEDFWISTASGNKVLVHIYLDIMGDGFAIKEAEKSQTICRSYELRYMELAEKLYNWCASN